MDPFSRKHGFLDYNKKGRLTVRQRSLFPDFGCLFFEILLLFFSAVGVYLFFSSLRHILFDLQDSSLSFSGSILTIGLIILGLKLEDVI